MIKKYCLGKGKQLGQECTNYINREAMTSKGSSCDLCKGTTSRKLPSNNNNNAAIYAFNQKCLTDKMNKDRLLDKEKRAFLQPIYHNLAENVFDLARSILDIPTNEPGVGSKYEAIMRVRTDIGVKKMENLGNVLVEFDAEFSKYICDKFNLGLSDLSSQNETPKNRLLWFYKSLVTALIFKQGVCDNFAAISFALQIYHMRKYPGITDIVYANTPGPHNFTMFSLDRDKEIYWHIDPWIYLNYEDVKGLKTNYFIVLTLTEFNELHNPEELKLLLQAGINIYRQKNYKKDFFKDSYRFNFNKSRRGLQNVYQAMGIEGFIAKI